MWKLEKSVKVGRHRPASEWRQHRTSPANREGRGRAVRHTDSGVCLPPHLHLNILLSVQRGFISSPPTHRQRCVQDEKSQGGWCLVEVTLCFCVLTSALWNFVAPSQFRILKELLCWVQLCPRLCPRLCPDWPTAHCSFRTPSVWPATWHMTFNHFSSFCSNKAGCCYQTSRKENIASGCTFFRHGDVLWDRVEEFACRHVY